MLSKMMIIVAMAVGFSSVCSADEIKKTEEIEVISPYAVTVDNANICGMGYVELDFAVDPAIVNNIDSAAGVIVCLTKKEAALLLKEQWADEIPELLEKWKVEYVPADIGDRIEYAYLVKPDKMSVKVVTKKVFAEYLAGRESYFNLIGDKK